MERPDRRVEIEDRRRLLDDFFRVDEAVLRFERFSGAMSAPTRRLSFERGDSAAAVVVERETGDILLTEQFRYPTWEKGPGWMLEVAAGVIDDGEDPESTIRKEILEEMGYRVGALEPIAAFYVSPGGSSERIFLFFVEVSERDRVAEGGGVDAEGEDIRLVRIPVSEIGAAIASRRLVDAKTLVGLLWIQLHHSHRSGDR